MSVCLLIVVRLLTSNLIIDMISFDLVILLFSACLSLLHSLFPVFFLFSFYLFSVYFAVFLIVFYFLLWHTV